MTGLKALAAAQPEQQKQFVAGVDRAMDGFRQHGGTSSENRRDKLAGRNRQIGRDGRVDYLPGSAMPCKSDAWIAPKRWLA